MSASRRRRGYVPSVATQASSGLSELRQALRVSAETVTRFLEMLTGEAVVADVVCQVWEEAGSAGELGVDAGNTVVRRMAVLRGRTTDLPYLCAESRFAPERLPAPVLGRLENSDEPIGRVLAGHEVPFERLPSPGREPFEGLPPSVFGPLASEVVWSRSYQLLVGGRPTFTIHEWFLQAVLNAFVKPPSS